MKNILKMAFIAVILCNSVYAFAGNESVSIAYVPAETCVGDNGPYVCNNFYYKVILDYAGLDDKITHFNIGVKYAQAVKNSFKLPNGTLGDYAKSQSHWLRWFIAGGFLYYGMSFDDAINNVKLLLVQIKREYPLFHCEMLGMATVFDSKFTCSYNGSDYSCSAGTPDRLYTLGVVPENILTLNELYFAVTSGDIMKLGCSSAAAYGNATADGKVVLGANGDFWPGFSNDGFHGKSMNAPALVLIKNQGTKKDFVMISGLGGLVGTSLNNAGLFIGTTLSTDISDSSGYDANGKYMSLVVHRDAAERLSTYSQAVSYFVQKPSPSGWNVLIADKLSSDTGGSAGVYGVLEASPESYYGYKERKYNSVLHPDVDWNYLIFPGPVMATVNSFLLNIMPNNHTDPDLQGNVNRQVFRLDHYNSMLFSGLDRYGIAVPGINLSNKIDLDDLGAMMSYRYKASDSSQDDTDEDIFRTDYGHATIISILCKPADFILKVHFMPLSINGDDGVLRPNKPMYARIQNFGFLQ